ncbi:MAG: UbiA family prenyltransferase [Candidatus Diapherotrites archaeon]|nr:UbiA family prenyltransferase [Candidatus Diapherotrites archaeon]
MPFDTASQKSSGIKEMKLKRQLKLSPPAISILRPGNSFMATAATVLGFLISGGKLIFTPQLFTGCIVVFLISGAGMAVNDYFDRKTDARKKTTNNPIVLGKLSAPFVKNYSIALFLTGTVLSLFISLTAFAIAAIASVLLFAYAAKPQFKVAGNFVVASLTAASLIYGGIVLGQINAPLVLVASCAFFANLGREITKDLEDVQADKGNKKTLAMLASKQEITATIVLFYAAAIIFSIIPVTLNLFNDVFIYAVLVADTGFIYTVYLLLKPEKHENKKQENLIRSSKYSKISMLTALIAFLIGAVF